VPGKIQSGKMTGIGIVLETDINSVSAVIDSSFQ